jgi:NAD(P)H-hydrate epimerase
VLDISLSTQHEAELPTNEYLISPALLAPILQPRTAQFAHKGTYGQALIAAGSMGKLGAADLAARAALAAGAGLVTLHCPGGSTSTRAEIMTQADDNAQYITDIPLHNWDAIGFGPGVGTHQDTARALKLLLQNWKNGLVIDADGLNILSENPTWLSFLPQNTVLTPHPKEFSRLAGIITNDTELYAKATEFAQKYQVVLVLKGRHTMVCAPGGNIWFNPTGNPGMATAGMGDVLTGMITAYLANGLSPLYAALKAVFLHGLSGDRAMTEPHANHITAGDLVNHIGSNKL